MDEQQKELLRNFINLYKKANNKDAFIKMWEDVVNAPEPEPYTLKDAYENAYGSALAQL